MKVVIITQEDSFAIPQNTEKVIKMKGVEVVAVCVLETTSSLVNKKSLFIKGFGWWQTIKMGMYFVTHKIHDVLDRITGTRLLNKRRSLKAVAQHYKIPFWVISNPNSKEFLQQLEDVHVDVVVSFSAPVVFKKDLLNLPTMGCINLHCSYLPMYSGVMPSFWVLYHQEKSTGATVHYMDDKIDNGSILGQVEVSIDSGSSMLDVIHKTKARGGDLTCKVLSDMMNNTLQVKENKLSEGNYFTWPTVEKMQSFKKKGGRLV